MRGGFVFFRGFSGVGTLLALLLFPACGKQQFEVVPTTSMIQAPGSALIPPKIDILLAEDDTGSALEVYPTISQQMPGFLLRLEQRGWDYHYATIPLTMDRPMAQVIGSRYDSNWGSLWTPPYPGASSSAGMVSTAAFRGLFDYTAFLTLNDINNGLNGNEPGFANIRNALYNRAGPSGFLRPDAVLVLIVVGNGDDTSGVTYCSRSDGLILPCEQVQPALGTMQSSFNYFLGQYKSLKADPSLVKFFAAVASSSGAGCLGGYSSPGVRYQTMATALGGSSYDVCHTPIWSILDGISQRVQSTQLSFRTRYVFIDEEPNLNTVKITRYPGGDGARGEAVPQDPVNGWTYSGYLTNAYAVDYPAPMNQASGFAFELHGSARAVGSDTVSVSYKPAGAGNSSP